MPCGSLDHASRGHLKDAAIGSPTYSSSQLWMAVKMECRRQLPWAYHLRPIDSGISAGSRAFSNRDPKWGSARFLWLLPVSLAGR